MLINILIAQTSAETTNHPSTCDWKISRAFACGHSGHSTTLRRCAHLVHVIERRPKVNRDSRFAGTRRNRLTSSNSYCLNRKSMETRSEASSTLSTPHRNQPQSQEIPLDGQTFGRDLAGKMLPPILAIGCVLALWWGLYLIFPRLLPGPVSTFNEAVRLLSDGTFFFHMLQSLRRVFVGAAVAMIFSIAIGIYMGTVLMGERFSNRWWSWDSRFPV